jgi:flagellar hook-length control protein FliK
MGPTAPSAATTVPTILATTAASPATPVAAATAPSAPLAYPTPAQQIAPHVVALGQGPDGTHRMTLHLHPDDLGPVQIRVELLGNTINVALTGDDDSARDLLRGALTDLRRELAAAGLDAGKLDVTTHQPGTGSAGSGDDTGRAPRGDRNAAAGRSDDVRSATDGTSPRTFRRAGPTHPSGAFDVTV